jgi:SlyX protein
VDLEMKLAYQEQTITSLNEVIVDQGKEIEGLKASLKMLHRQVTQWMEDHSNASGSGVPHEKPPHY